MKMVLTHSGKYFVPIWASRTKTKIVAYWDKRFSVARVPVEEAHFTYPEDGDFHYTFYLDRKNNTCVRQFCDRLQYMQNGRKVKEVERTEANEIFPMQPLLKAGWEKLPLNQFDGKVVNLILPLFGFGLPFENSMAKSIFTSEKPRHSAKELIDISTPDIGSFNVNFILRGKNTELTHVKRPGKEFRFIVEDDSIEPIISLTLLHILPSEIEVNK